MLDLTDFIQALPSVLLVLVIVAGIAALTAGGDWLCRGAVNLAGALKVRPVIIGLTVVSAATSMPEFFTSLLGSLTGSPGVAIGNVIGSNVANIGLILAISALICPLVIRMRLIRIDVPIMIGVSLLFALLCWTNLTRFDGLILLAVLAGYLFFLVREARTGEVGGREIEEEVESQLHRATLRRSVLFVILGTLALVAGADLLVSSAVEMAGRIGVSEVLIGLTLVAIGTSLPELATSIVAAIRKHADLCAANIVGSNLMNMMLVCGLVATISPFEIERRLFVVEFPFMLFFALLLWPLFFTGRILSRKEGVVLLIFYGAFLGLTTVSQMGI